MKALYTDDFVENSSEGMTEYFDNEVETLNMDITAMLPVKIKGSDITRVLTWAVEDRLFQNLPNVSSWLAQTFTTMDKYAEQTDG